MCGIAGSFDLNAQTSKEELKRIAAAMADKLAHRGPDDSGTCVDADGGVAFAHRRLSIVDLAPSGAQPMTSADGRYVIVFNGEIYNHAELRKTLTSRGHAFRGHSDTEALLESIATAGLRPTLDRCNGMFAFALWDRQRHELTLVRDRLGIKPLYYARFGSQFLFGSELKALRCHPAFESNIDRDAIDALMRFGYVPAPGCIWKNVRKLKPGELLTISTAEPQETLQTWWSFAEIAQESESKRLRFSTEAATDALAELIEDSVRLRMQADVPVGAFLSGGIDSSLVVSMMQRLSASQANAFTIGFEDPEFDESESARQIAQHLQVAHHIERMSSAEVRERIPLLPDIYDEPFADSSQLPTRLVCEIARKGVTVALSGDGGDELFGGYNRYAHIASIWRKIGWMPLPLRKMIAAAWQTGVHRGIRRRSGQSFRSTVMRSADRRELYSRLNRHWNSGDGVVPNGSTSRAGLEFDTSAVHRGTAIEEFMAMDMTHYLPDDILTKVDRASMSVGLEVRVPLLDHRIVEFAWQLPHHLKFDSSGGKLILQKLLSRFIPRTLFERPKVGFGIPLGSWLRGPLREWGEELLSEERLRREGYLNPEPVQTRWEAHISGRENWQYHLWDVLMFQAWLDRQS